jgi:MFS transporter, putative metabolite:H+ symporter
MMSALTSSEGITSKALNLPQRMERLPLTRYQKIIFLIIATAWLFDSMDLALMTFVLAPISKAFSLTSIQTGFLGSASLAGMALGAALAGMLADRVGRKIVFQWSMVVWGSAALLCAVAPDYNFLLAARFILGFGMGAEFPIAL